jgi:hypothetical protein
MRKEEREEHGEKREILLQRQKKHHFLIRHPGFTMSSFLKSSMEVKVPRMVSSSLRMKEQN